MFIIKLLYLNSVLKTLKGFNVNSRKSHLRNVVIQLSKNIYQKIMLEQNIQNKVNTWLSGDYDQNTKDEIQKLLSENKENELKEAFYKDLEFGTGGLRGIMGVGSNRMNKYTVGMATQGLANYIKKCFPINENNTKIKVAIAYDSRNNSVFFANIVADVFSASGFEVYIFESLRPTPELSFAIRHLGCKSGVMVTASHNPREYNGYKAYWDDGAQFVAPHDQNVIDEIAKMKVEDVNFQGVKENIHIIGKEIDSLYQAQILAQSINKDIIKKHKNLKIVYTPLHGAGITQVPQVLKMLGFEQVSVLKEQEKPDGNFPTVVFPNPEEAEALTLALKLAKELNADLVLATDPDADRLGVAVKNEKGEFVLLNGNQTGSLILYYLLNAWEKAGKITGNQYIVKTIVTTELMDNMAKKMGVACYNTLTGFKYIAEVIRQHEKNEVFIAGGEESYGFMIGDFVRDKDGIAAAAIVAEICAYAAENGISLYEMLKEMYVEYGYYYETLISVTMKGISGAEDIKKMMQDFRNMPPIALAGSKVVLIKDFQALTEKNILTGEQKTLDFPEKSNVLQFFTEDGSKISARPSGTEPKIKFYVGLRQDLPKKEDFDEVTKVLSQKATQIKKDLGL